MIYEAGATEVHLGIACPPITNPDFYGIDTPNLEELIAAKKSIEEINKEIGSTSLFFLSLNGTYKALGEKNRDNSNPQFTDHCFTGDYPIEVADHKSYIKQSEKTLKQYTY